MYCNSNLIAIFVNRYRIHTQYTKNMREIITYKTNRRTINAISYRDLVSQMEKGESLLVQAKDLSGIRVAAYWLKGQNYGKWITKPVANGKKPAIMLMRID